MSDYYLMGPVVCKCLF